MTETIARIAQEPSIEVTATLRLTEPELRALALMSDFNIAGVVQALAVGLSSGFREKRHADAIESLIEMIRREVRPILRRTDAARKAFSDGT
jgi:DNA-binding NarL/FixJ family response regulator